jgi:hypothetical protein
MSHNLAAESKCMSAIAPSIGTIGTMTPIEVNCAGFDRVMYIATLGVAGAGGLFDMKVQDSATTGGALADITGAVLTQVTKAAGDSTCQVIDVKVNPAKLFHKLTVVTTTGAFPNSVTAVLYRGSGPRPPALVAGTQAVIV